MTAGSLPMPIDLTVPTDREQPLNLRLEAGDILFVLGANGAGKSALMHEFYNSTHTRVHVQRRVAVRHAVVTGDDVAERLADAKAAAETAIWPHVQRLSERGRAKCSRPSSPTIARAR